MRSFGAMVLVYRQADYLDACLQAAAGHFERIVCMFTDAPFVEYNRASRADFGGDDGSAAILDRHARRDSRVHVVSGEWDSEEAMRTDGLRLLKEWGLDYTFVLDADEFYPEGKLHAIQTWIAGDGEHTRFQVRYRNLYRRMDYEIEPDAASVDHLWQNVCYRTKDVTSFDCGRTVRVPRVRLPEEYFFWHLGWVLPDERMREKIATYSHAAELPQGWFREKWLGWTPSTADLCPYEYAEWPRTRQIDPQSLPTVLHSHPLFPGSRSDSEADAVEAHGH